MSHARCPACGGAVPHGAPWCTLCYADLRPKPASVPAPTASVPAQPMAPDPLTAPLTEVAAQPPAATGVAAQAAQPAAAAPTWPCRACGGLVDLGETACPTCGAPFLSADTAPLSLRLPWFGEVSRLSPAGRAGLMAAGSVVVSAVLLAVLALVGLVL